MPYRKHLNKVNMVAIAGLIAFAAWLGYDVIFPIHQIHSVVVRNPEIKHAPRMELCLDAVVSRRKTCDPTVIRFFRRLPNRDLIYTTKSPGAAGGLGTRLNVPFCTLLPPDVFVPGEYQSDGFVINTNCGETFSVPSPAVTFRVVP